MKDISLFKTFTYKSYTDCYIMEGRYPNGNLGLTIYNDKEGQIANCTTNPNVTIPEDYVAIKDYSENEGMVDFLKSIGLIVEEPITYIESGYVFIPIYRLNDNAKDMIVTL